MSGARRRLFLLHLVANALLLWLGYEWLGVGESTRMRLVWSAVDALAILGLVCWFHGATLVFFRKGDEARINDAFRVALRHVPALVTAAVVVLALYGLLAWAAGASGQPAFRLASWLTLKLRTPVRPATVARVFLGGFWLVRWMVLPVALLPMASGIACSRMARVQRVYLARRMALLAGGSAAAGGGIAAALRAAWLGARGERFRDGGS